MGGFVSTAFERRTPEHKDAAVLNVCHGAFTNFQGVKTLSSTVSPHYHVALPVSNLSRLGEEWDVTTTVQIGLDQMRKESKSIVIAKFCVNC